MRGSINDFIKSSLFKYFLSFFAVVITVVSVLGFVLSSYFSSEIEKVITKSTVNTTMQIRSVQDIVLKEVASSINMIAFDRAIPKAVEYYDERKMSELRSILIKLTRMQLTFDNIESVAVCFPEERRVLSSNYGYQYYEDYFDKDFIESLPRELLRGRLVKSRAENKTISFVRAMPLGRPDNPAQYIVVNVNSGYLSKVLDSLQMPEQTCIAIVDNSGRIIFCSDSDYIQPISELELTNRIEGSDAEVYREKLGNQHVLVTLLQSEIPIGYITV